MTKVELAKLMAVCAAAFPHVTVTKETMTVYAEALADLEFEPSQRAVMHLIATSQYFPSIASIRESYASLIAPSAPSIAKAWQEVSRRIQREGSTMAPTWSHQTIAEAVLIVGWRELCLSENQIATRAHFWRVYESLAKDHKMEAILGQQRRLDAP